MAEYICSVCKKKFDDEEKELTSDVNKCILHCEKTNTNGWFTFSENGSLDWSSSKDKRIYFWDLFNSLDDYDSNKEKSLIPPLVNDNEGHLFIYDGIVLDGLILHNTNELSILHTKVRGNIMFYDKKEYTKLHFIDTKHNGDIIVVSGGDVDIYFKDIQVNLIKLGNKEKNIIPNYYKTIEIIGDETSIKTLNMYNLHLLNTFKMNNIKVEKFHSLNTIFDKKVEIKESKFIKTACFKNVKFKSLCDFYKTKFNCTRFEKTTFTDISILTESEFIKLVNFKYTTFSKLALFRNTKFKDTVNFVDSIFKDESNFLDMKNDNNDKLESKNIANRETARIIKDSFEQQNNIIEANKYYAIEMEKREEELERDKKKNWFEWLVFKIHDISSNHSQDALLALFWIISLTFFYSHIKTFDEQPFTEYYAIPVFLSLLIIIFNFCEIFENKRMSIKMMASIILASYVIYAFSTLDCKFYEFSNNLNPFAIMTGLDELNLTTLIYRTIIAYLIYQFVVSIRQNTRRK